jgi:uncharacterized protein
VRVALDTNVVVAAFATRGLCSDLFLALVAQHEVIIPEPAIAEIERAFAAKLRFPRNQIAQIVAYLRDVAQISKPVSHSVVAKADREDAAIVSSAAQAGAEAFVTGDQKVLAAGKIESMAMLSPRAMWERLSGSTA